MSQAGANSLSGGGGGGSGVQTISGDLGNAITPIAGDIKISALLAGTTQFVNGNDLFPAQPATWVLTATDGNSNTIIGNNTRGSVDNLFGNSGFGDNAIGGIQLGSSNSAFGTFAMSFFESGDSNTAIGYGALQSLLTGSFNIGIGTTAGIFYASSESHNISINSLGVVGESNVLRIGNGTGTGTQQLQSAYISGISGVTVSGAAMLIDSNGQMGTIVSSIKFKENIEPISDVVSEKIYALKPSTFTIKDKPDMHMFGLIAEEVMDVLPELVIMDNDNEPFSVKYHELPVLLLNEIKKLREEINQLKGV